MPWAVTISLFSEPSGLRKASNCGSVAKRRCNRESGTPMRKAATAAAFTRWSISCSSELARACGESKNLASIVGMLARMRSTNRACA